MVSTHPRPHSTGRSRSRLLRNGRRHPGGITHKLRAVPNPGWLTLRVVQLWAVGDILGTVRDVETVTVALAVDLPVGDVPG